ncbi:MAG: hypothetical protein WBB45_06520 [Cyclobacteriaceae bacterium]
MSDSLPNFQIQGIDIQEISIKQPEGNLGRNPNLNFNIHLDHAVMQENQLFIVGTTITTHAQENQLLATYKANCVFRIENMGQYATGDEKGGVSLPEELMSMLNSISVSTTRGLMYGGFAGTYLQKVVLPVIDTDAFALNKG